MQYLSACFTQTSVFSFRLHILFLYSNIFYKRDIRLQSLTFKSRRFLYLNICCVGWMERRVMDILPLCCHLKPFSLVLYVWVYNFFFLEEKPLLALGVVCVNIYDVYSSIYLLNVMVVCDLYVF